MFENFCRKILRFLQENLKILQEILVFFAGKSKDFYKKMLQFLRANLPIFSGTFGDFCKQIFTIFGIKFTHFY